MSTLSEATTAGGRAWTVPRGRRHALLVVLLVLSTVVGWGAVRYMDGTRAPAVPVSPAVEATWGVQFTAVNVTADGGLVDVRFVVLDPSKATALMADRDVVPRLAAEHDGEAVFLPAATMHRQMAAGRTYFLLYRNTGGLIRSGHEIALLVGDLRIDGVVPG